MKKYNVYAASCLEDGGIYKYDLSEEGRLKPTASIRLDRPMYFVKNGDTLHTLLRAPEGLGGNSGYLEVSSDLTRVSEISTTDGVVACHLAVTGEGVYAVNYLSGNISRIGGITVTHQKSEHNREGRQDMPHTHFVGETPDGKYLAVCDLGLDKIFIYNKELNPVSDVSLPQGSGVRHLVFSRDGKYAYTANELDSSTSVLVYADGKLTLLSTVRPELTAEENYPAAIRLSPTGDRLYVSQRGMDAVSIYGVDGGSLTFLRNVSTYGSYPRDIALTPDGRFILAACEGGVLTVLDSERDYALSDSVELPSALCVYCE